MTSPTANDFVTYDFSLIINKYMDKTLGTIQIAISILLILSILLQNRGSGLSETFGGSGNAYQTKRGFDKFLLMITVVLAVLFLGTSFYGFIQS